MPRPRVLVFDLDDTLYPERLFALSGFHAVAAWLQENRSVEGFYECSARLFEQGHRRTIFDVALADLGVAHDAALVARLVEVYRGHTPRIRLHDDAAWALEHLGRRHALALLTDGPAMTQRNKVAALGIARHFAALVYSDDFGREHWKPSPVPYETVMRITGAAGADCLYVADNPAKDFVATRALGWTSVQVLREDGEYRDVVAAPGFDAHYRISSLYELAELLEDEIRPKSLPGLNRDSLCE